MLAKLSLRELCLTHSFISNCFVCVSNTDKNRVVNTELSCFSTKSKVSCFGTKSKILPSKKTRLLLDKSLASRREVSCFGTKSKILPSKKTRLSYPRFARIANAIKSKGLPSKKNRVLVTELYPRDGKKDNSCQARKTGIANKSCLGRKERLRYMCFTKY